MSNESTEKPAGDANIEGDVESVTVNETQVHETPTATESEAPAPESDDSDKE